MPGEGRLKSRTFRRVKTRIPSGTVTHYVRRKPAKAQCGNCGIFLHGVARARPGKLQNMPKSQKRPSRPYGGVLCSRCSRRVIVDKIRGMLSLSSNP